MTDSLKRLVLEVQAKVGNTVGFEKLDREFDGILGKQRKLAAQAKLNADTQIKEANRQALAIDKANDKIALSHQRLADLQVRQSWAASRGSIQAYQSLSTAIEREYEKIKLSSQMLADEQIRQSGRVAAAGIAQANAAAASARAASTGRNLAIAGGLSRVGGVAIGAGAVGLGVGYELLKQGSGWQKYVAQNVANSPMTAAESAAFQRLAFQTAGRTGASPQDVFYALRLGSEMRLNQGQDRRYLSSALALGLPTGGSAAVAPSLQAIATVAHNFPQFAGKPNAIANMLLATTQNSAGGINVQQLTENMPGVLSIAGHIGGKSSLADALAIYASLSQTGMGAPEISTQATNFIKQLVAGTARPNGMTSKTLEALRTQRGIDLFPDFSQAGLQQKGLGGVLTDIKNANIDQKTLFTLFPNMRGTLAALGLTGNQYKNFMNVQPTIAGAANQNLIGKNLQNYLGLTGVQMQRFEQQLHVLAITTGTQLLPVFNQLLKEDLIPGAKAVADFTKETKGLIVELVKLSPWLIGAGVGLKLVAGGMSLIVKASEGELLIQKFATAIGLIGPAATEAETALGVSKTAGLAGSIGTVESAATGAVGIAGSGAVGGAGLLGLAAALGVVGGSILGVFAAIAAAPFPKLGGNATVNGVKGHYEVVGNGRMANRIFVPDGPGQSTFGNKDAMVAAGLGIHTGPFPATQMIKNFPRWLGGQGGVPFGGGSFGAFNAPASGYQNRNIATEYQYGEGTPASNAQRVKWYQSSSILGSGGVIMDTDFMNNGKQGSQPIKLPGSRQDIWTFVKYVKDPDNAASNGGMAAIWIDPMGNRVLFWHMNPNTLTLKPGAKFRGGDKPMWSWEENGAWHMCIVSSPQVRKDLTVLTNPTFDAAYDKWQAAGGNGKSPVPHVPLDNSSLALDPGLSRTGGLFASYGAKYHIDPAILAGMGAFEGAHHVDSGAVNSQGYGTMGSNANRPDHGPMFGSSAKGQVRGAASQLRYWINWCMTHPAFMKAHARGLAAVGIKNPLSNEAYLAMALAIYNVGVAGDIDGTGLPYAMKEIKQGTIYNHGNLPATYYRAPSARSAATTGGGTGNGVGVSLGAGAPLTPMQKWQKRQTGDENAIANLLMARGWDPSTPISKVKDPFVRKQLYGFQHDANYAKYQQILLTIDSLPISEHDKEILRKDAYASYKSGGIRAIPLPAKSAKAGKNNPQTPFQWSQWWSGRAGTLQGTIGTVAGTWPNANLTNPNVTQRAILTPLLDSYFKDKYKSTIALDRSEYKDHPKLMREAVAAATALYHGELRHPFWNFFGGTKTSAGGGAHVTPVQVVGSNKQLGTAEAHLKVAEKQLHHLEHLDRGQKKQIQQLEREIKTLVKWINHHGGHVTGGNNGHDIGVVPVQP